VTLPRQGHRREGEMEMEKEREEGRGAVESNNEYLREIVGDEIVTGIHQGVVVCIDGQEGGGEGLFLEAETVTDSELGETGWGNTVHNWRRTRVRERGDESSEEG